MNEPLPEVNATQIKLPAIGIGTTAIGGMFEPVSSIEAQEVFDAAYLSGIRYFDTAPMYGLSLSERRLGQFLDRVGGDAVAVSTKVGRVVRPRRLLPGGGSHDDFGWRNTPDFAQTYDYSYDGIMRSIEDSLQRIGRGHVEVLYIHDIGRGNHGDNNDKYVAQLRDGGYRALDELKQTGVAGAIGLGVNDSVAVLETLEDFDLDWCLLANQYTLIENEGSTRVFEECARRGVRLVAGGVFNSGVLAGDSHYRYGDVPVDVRTKVAALRGVCDAFGIPLQAAAIQFVERSGHFDSLLVGPRSVEELEQLLAWREVHIPEELWADMVGHDLIVQRPSVPGAPGEGTRS